MEVAGVVLGAIPLALYAVDNYHRSLRSARNYFEYSHTLNEIKRNLFIQQRQLQTTLENMGLNNPSLQETKELLQYQYPESAFAFMDVLHHMDTLLLKLMDKLDIDIEDKPNWINGRPERVSWEWRKVKRSFKSKERREIFDELDRLNNSLRNCLGGRREVMSDETDPLAARLIKSFDKKACNDIRTNARILHETLTRAWLHDCHFHNNKHLSNLQLKWHDRPLGFSRDFTLLIPDDCTQQQACETWRRVSLEVVEQHRHSVSPMLSSCSPSAIFTESSTTPPTGSNIKRLASPVRQRTPRFVLPIRSGTTEATESVHSTTQIQTAAAGQELSGWECISNLCGLEPRMNLNVYVRRSALQDGGKLVRIKQVERTLSRRVPLTELLPGQHSLARRTTHETSGVSRKERLGTASAITWAVLILCGTPWLEDTYLCNKHIDIHMSTHSSSEDITLPCVTCFSHTYESPQMTSPSTQSAAAVPDSSIYRDNRIRHKMLFSLGILLIELALNTPFERLREEAWGRSSGRADEQGKGLASTPSPEDDYEIANNFIEDVAFEREFGGFYIAAVQRCIQCLFTGRESTRNFDHESFRRQFYTGVVAPVQATYESEVSPSSLGP